MENIPTRLLILTGHSKSLHLAKEINFKMTLTAVLEKLFNIGLKKINQIAQKVTILFFVDCLNKSSQIHKNNPSCSISGSLIKCLWTIKSTKLWIFKNSGCYSHTRNSLSCISVS